MAKTFTAATAAKMSLDDREDLTLAELVAAFNAMVAKTPALKPVTRFADRTSALKRVAQLQQQVGVVLLEEEMAAAAMEKVGKVKPGRKADGAPSVSSRCQQLIKAGKTNDQVWAVVKKEFSLDDTKKSYPAWNRSKLRRDGVNV